MGLLRAPEQGAGVEPTPRGRVCGAEAPGVGGAPHKEQAQTRLPDHPRRGRGWGTVSRARSRLPRASASVCHGNCLPRACPARPSGIRGRPLQATVAAPGWAPDGPRMERWAPRAVTIENPRLGVRRPGLRSFLPVWCAVCMGTRRSLCCPEGAPGPSGGERRAPRPRNCALRHGGVLRGFSGRTTVLHVARDAFPVRTHSGALVTAGLPAL